MWLKILLFLGIVVCSFSAPTRSPAPVTQPWNHVNAIKEALILLDNTPDIVSEVSEGERVWLFPDHLLAPCLSAW